MPEVATRTNIYRFAQIAKQVSNRVEDPTKSGVQRYVGLEHLDANSLRIRRWGKITDVESTKLRFQPGDIIFGKRRVYQRKLAVADFEGICSAHAMVLRANPAVVLPEFLPFFMQSDHFMERALEISVGSLSPTINWKTLAREEFALPPIDEQRRIADVLSAQERLLIALERMQESLIVTQSAYFEHILESELGDLQLTPVGNLLTESPRNGLSPTTNSSEAGFRTVSIGAVSQGRFDPEGHIKYVEISREAAEPFLVRAGDMFAVRGNGNRNLTGKIGLAHNDYEDLIYPDLLIRLSFDASRILREFALGQWNLPSVHTRLIARAKSSNGIWKVNGQDIRAHQIAVPPLQQQQAILNNLHQIAAGAEDAGARRRALKLAKAAVMRRALGESMSNFSESNAIGTFISDQLCGGTTSSTDIDPRLTRHGNKGQRARLVDQC